MDTHQLDLGRPPAGTWPLSPSRSRLAFRTRHFWGRVEVRGGFGHLDGAGHVDGAGRVTVALRADTASLDTGIGRRDAHLRGADFFAAERHPWLVFAGEAARLAGDGLHVSGTLTVAGHERRIEFPAAVHPTADGHVAISAELTVDRRDFGMTWSPLRVAAFTTTVTAHLEFTAPGRGAGTPS